MAALVGAGLFLGALGDPRLAPPALAGAALALQGAKSAFKGPGGQVPKRSCRILGFVLGIAMAGLWGEAFFALAFGMALLTAGLGRRPSAAYPEAGLRVPRFGRLSGIMVLHQMHYFIYCYPALILAWSLGGWGFSALLFFLMWGTYTFSPGLLYRGGSWALYLALAHLALVPVLVGVYFAGGPTGMLILCPLTGFFGTTVFCIGRLGRKMGPHRAQDSAAAENLGHILGTGACLSLYLAQGSLWPHFLLAAALAGAVALSVLMLKIQARGEAQAQGGKAWH
jgi:hypothetical protein